MAVKIRLKRLGKIRNPQYRIVIAGGRDAWRVADELAAAKVPVIFESTFDQPIRDTDAYDAQFKAAATLHKITNANVLLSTAATTPWSLRPSQLPPASWSSPATTSGRSGQWRPGGNAGRSAISSRLAPTIRGQAWPGRRRRTILHMGIHPLP